MNSGTWLANGNKWVVVVVVFLLLSSFVNFYTFLRSNFLTQSDLSVLQIESAQNKDMNKEQDRAIHVAEGQLGELKIQLSLIDLRLKRIEELLVDTKMKTQTRRMNDDAKTLGR